MATLGDLIVRVGAEIDGFTSGMKSVMDRMDEAADKVEDRFESIGNAGKRLAIVGAAMTTAITVPLEEIARRSLEVAGNMEQTQIAFTTLLHSAGAAKEMLGDLYKFAADTPFEIPQVLAGARQIMAYGFAAKDVIPILKIVGDTSAALGTGGDGMQRILANLGKIQSQGKLTGHELRDLGNDGVAAISMLATELGKTPEQIHKIMSATDGTGLKADVAIPALLRGMQAQYGGLMKDQMSTFKGQLSNLKDQVTLAAAAIGEALLPVGKAMVDWAQQALGAVKELAKWFGSLPDPIKGAAIALAGMIAALGPILGLVGAAGMAFPGLAAAVTALATAFEISVGAVLGWGAVISAGVAVVVVALGALAVWVYEHWDGIKAFLGQVFSGLRDIWHATLGVAIDWVVGKVQEFISWSMPAWQGLGEGIKAVWQDISEFVQRIWGGLKSNVIDPLMHFLGSVPGMSKIAGAGDAFTNADNKARTDKEVKELERHLGVGKDKSGFQYTSPRDKWIEDHNRQVEEANKNLTRLTELYKAGSVSAKDFAEAQRNVDLVKSAKMPAYMNATEDTVKHGSSKINHNALDGLSGEHAHEEALLALQKAQIEHEYQMDQTVVAAQKRKVALDQIALEERNASIATINSKLKLYKDDQAGHQKLIEAKTAAEDKYNAAIQKTTFDLETIKKQSHDREEKEAEKQEKERERLQQKAYQDSIKAVDSKVQTIDTLTQGQQRHEQSLASIADKRLQFELENGYISKAQYLRLKQEQFDAAYQMELDALERERALIEKEFADLIAKAETVEQRSRAIADRDSRLAKVKDREQVIGDRHAGEKQDTDIGLKRDQMDRFKQFQSGLQGAFQGLIQGTKSFRQAWGDMVSGMVSQWAGALAKMAARWVTHKLMELTLHIGTNQAKVASDATAAAESNTIGMQLHLKEVVRHAASAAAAAFKAVAGIPIVGPVLAPAAAAAAFVGTMAFGSISAERGAVLPDENTVAFLHPKEMVLPRNLSEGLQSMFNNGGNMLANPNALAYAQGGGMNSSALQAISGATSAGGGDTNFHGGVQLTVHNSAKDPLTADKVFGLFQQAVRMKNLKIA